jgi:hypothetical protein
MSIDTRSKAESSGLKSAVNASLEVMNGAVILKLNGEQGNPGTIIIGNGTEGPTVIVDGQGGVHVVPTGGPGPVDTELMAAFKSLYANLTMISDVIMTSKGIYVLCPILGWEIDKLQRQIIKNELPLGETPQQAERQLAQMTAKYVAQGCNK